jgi:predicted dehydrogenase
MDRVAAVGCGYWGPNLIRNLLEIAGVEVSVICDRDLARAQAIQNYYPQLKITTSYEEVLADSSIDAVVLATPAQTHARLAEAALLAGKHTFVEKPLALATPDCIRLTNLARKQERVLMVGHTFLYNDAVARLQKILEAGDLGSVLYLHARRLNLGQIRQDVNALWNLAPHDISIMIHLLKEMPERVSARGYKFLRQENEDLVTVTLEFPSGKVGFIDVSWLSPNKVRDLTIVGSEKMALYNDVDPDATIVIYDKGVDAASQANSNFGEFQYKLRFGDVRIPHVRVREPLRVELGHFLECIRNGTEPLSGGENGTQVVRVLEAAQESLSRGGSPVRINQGLSIAA